MPDEPPLEPELPPPLGMLELEPPELPDDPPEDPDEPPDEPPDGLGMVGEGMLLLEDDPAHPPMRKAEVALINVVCAAMTNSRRREWLVGITCSPVALVAERDLLKLSTSKLSEASSKICDLQAEHSLIRDQPTLVSSSSVKFLPILDTNV
jgi:hypothetical protein